MQLPPDEEIVMVSGTPPVRAKKARYYEDARLTERVLPPPTLTMLEPKDSDQWSCRPLPPRPKIELPPETVAVDIYNDDSAKSELRHQPELSRGRPIDKKESLDNEFAPDLGDDAEGDPAALKRLTALMQGNARQASLDRGDDLEM
jgi:type IV secretion system protein VirD4